MTAIWSRRTCRWSGRRDAAAQRRRSANRACIRSDPSQRPSCHDLFDVAASTLHELGVSCEVLSAWSEHARRLAGNRPSSVSAWGSGQLAAVSPENLREEVRHLEARLAACDLTTDAGRFD